MKYDFSSKFFITRHAVEQLLSRKHLLSSEKDMFYIIRRHINKNIYKLEQKTRSGEDQWFIPSLDCVLISKPENGKNVVVTIIKNKFSLCENSFEENLMQSLLKFDTTNKNKENEN